MNQEALALQTALWDVIVVVGVIGGLIVALVLACLFCRREPSTRFEPGQWVKVVRVLESMYGPSVSVPKGAIIQLIDRFDTSEGPRWSAKWKRVHLHSVPEEFIEPYDWKEGPRAEGLGPRASGSHVGLPAGIWVASCDGNGDGNWKWIVHDPVTGLAIESGTEPTELRAINMAWAAYDRATEADTAIVEERATGQGLGTIIHADSKAACDQVLQKWARENCVEGDGRENKVATDQPIRPVSLDGLFVLLGTMGPDEIALISPRRRLSQAEIAGLSESLPDNLRGRVVLLERCDATIRKAVS